MSQLKTLLQPSDIVKFTIVSPHFPTCDLRTLYGIEFFEGLNCLGKEFYQQLLGDLNDYSAVLPYSNTQTYNTDDLVAYKGVIYVALVDALTGVIPTTVEKWDTAPRFATQCFEDLFCLFLGEYLSWVVIRNRLPFVATKITAEGVVKVMGENFAAAGDKDFHTLQKAVIAQVDRAYYNLHSYIMANETNECYKNYKSILEADGCKGADCIEQKAGNYAYRIG